VANSLALARAGITRDTAAPKGVEILKDASGEPTGVFVEHNLVQILEFTLLRGAPRFEPADRRKALVESQRQYAARGVTAVYEGHGVAPEVLQVYRQTHERGELALRCTLALSPPWQGPEEGQRAIPDLAAWAGGRGTGDDRLRLAGICLHYGGDAEVAGILHASQPYTGWAGFVESFNTPDGYRRQAEVAARHGVRVNTLITRSLPEVLAIWESIASTTPVRDRRWVAVHLNAASRDELVRLKRLGAVATTNPISYLWRSAAEEARKLAEPAQLLPHRSLVRLGIPFGLATDNKPADPWLAFAAVVARRDMVSGAVLGPAERLSRVQALRALTVGGAWVTFAERERGILASGRQADLAVLEQDPLRLPLEEISSLNCRLTMVGGRIVHGRV
jgi:predicted amidohydrolase YtcJ